MGAQSIMANATDEHEHRSGVRREPLFLLQADFAVGMASGLGGFITGAALDLIRFPAALTAKGGELI